MTKWFVTIEVRPLRPTDDAFVALDHGALTHLAGVLEDIGASPVGGVDHYGIVTTREAAEGHQAFDYVRDRFRETRSTVPARVAGGERGGNLRSGGVGAHGAGR